MTHVRLARRDEVPCGDDVAQEAGSNELEKIRIRRRYATHHSPVFLTVCLSSRFFERHVQHFIDRVFHVLRRDRGEPFAAMIIEFDLSALDRFTAQPFRGSHGSKRVSKHAPRRVHVRLPRQRSRLPNDLSTRRLRALNRRRDVSENVENAAPPYESFRITGEHGRARHVKRAHELDTLRHTERVREHQRRRPIALAVVFIQVILHAVAPEKFSPALEGCKDVAAKRFFRGGERVVLQRVKRSAELVLEKFRWFLLSFFDRHRARRGDMWRLTCDVRVGVSPCI